MALDLLLFSILGILGPGDVGTTAFPLLKVPVGPRACAMGETFTGLADDANSIFWNPAGLGQLSGAQFGFAHQEWFGGIRDENLSLATPLGPGCLGVGAVYSVTGGIELWNEENEPGGTTATRGGYLSVGYGIQPTNAITCGAAAKGLYDKLVETAVIGAGFDLGTLWRPFYWLRVGTTVQNLGPSVRYGSEEFMLPMALAVGVCYEQTRFRALLDVRVPVDNSPDLHLGGEYSLHEHVTARGGLRIGPQDLATLGWASIFTAGAGFNFDEFTLDYALVPYGQLGLTHRLALRLELEPQVLGRVRIKVLEYKSNRPVKAMLVLEGRQQGPATTEEDGCSIVEGIQPGWLKITARADGYHPVIESVFVQARMTRNVKLLLHKSGFGSLWGAVYDAVTRKPLAVRVDYNGPSRGSLETEENQGSFMIRKLPAGDYDLAFTPHDSDLLGQTATVTVEPGRLTSQTFHLCRVSSGVRPDSVQSGVLRSEAGTDEAVTKVDTSQVNVLPSESSEPQEPDRGASEPGE